VFQNVRNAGVVFDGSSERTAEQVIAVVVVEAMGVTDSRVNPANLVPAEIFCSIIVSSFLSLLYKD